MAFLVNRDAYNPYAIRGGTGSEHADEAYQEEIALLQKLEDLKTQQARFLTTEGKGVAREGTVLFGHETDLEGLSEEEREMRATGRLELDTGLFL